MKLIEFVAARIRELRMGHGGNGLSQQELAQAIGTTANTISRWETGTYKPTIEDLEKLSRFFGVSIVEFFPSAKESKEPQINALLRAAKNLRSSDLDELRRYAEFRMMRSGPGKSASR